MEKKKKKVFVLGTGYDQVLSSFVQDSGSLKADSSRFFFLCPFEPFVLLFVKGTNEYMYVK